MTKALSKGRAGGDNLDYRKIYKDYYGIEFGKDFEVHHIDGNRDNNDIQNLLLLPAKLHKKYHFYVNEFRNTSPHQTSNGFFTISIDLTVGNSYVPDMENHIKKLLAVMRECNEWHTYKMNLDYMQFCKARR